MSTTTQTPDPAAVFAIFQKKMALSSSLVSLDRMKKENASILFRPLASFASDAQVLQKFIHNWQAK